MRLLLSIFSITLNVLGILLLLLVIALGHMATEGLIVALICIGMAALNILAILFGARAGRRRTTDVQATAQTFE